MRFKLIAFDLDGTLAPIGKGITPANLEKLRTLEAMGYRIVICSGKSEYYLCGLLRQLELKAPVIVAENGAVIRFGIGLPPEKFSIQPFSREAAASLAYIRKAIADALPGCYFQPNNVGVTPFPRSEAEFDLIQDIIDRSKDKLRDVVVYRHADSFDITPKDISKFTGMCILAEMCGVAADSVIAVGDGINDYPMFEFAGYSIGIKLPADRADVVFDTIDEVMDHLLSL